LLYEIGNHFKIDLTDVPIIGDSLRDIQAARMVGGFPILVKTGKGERTLDTTTSDELDNVPVYENLAAAVDAILNRVN
jgi:D-glycero-D-manno-heptose 1,7-bisphosphate phosphatase